MFPWLARGQTRKQEGFNSLGRDGGSRTSWPRGQCPFAGATAKWQRLRSPFPTQRSPSDLPSWETKKGQAKKRGSSSCWMSLHWEVSSESFPHGHTWVLGHSPHGDPAVSGGSALNLCWERRWRNPWGVVWVILAMFTAMSKYPLGQPVAMGNPLTSEMDEVSGYQQLGLNLNKVENLKESTAKYARHRKPSSEANQCPRCPYNKI